MKKERLLSFNHDCVTDAATTNLLDTHTVRVVS